MKIDYIRLFQDPDDSTHTTSCNPEAYPTQQFIADHPERFREWAPPEMPPSSELPQSPLPLPLPDGPVSPPAGIDFKEMLTLFILFAFCLLFWGIITFIVSKFRAKFPTYLHHYHYRTPSQQQQQEEEEQDQMKCGGPESFLVQINENTALLTKKASPCVNYSV